MQIGRRREFGVGRCAFFVSSGARWWLLVFAGMEKRGGLVCAVSDGAGLDAGRCLRCWCEQEFPLVLVQVLAPFCWIFWSLLVNYMVAPFS